MTEFLSATVFYLDTSALVKRYVVETGSSWITELCRQGSESTVASARITHAEAAAAFARKARVRASM